MSVMGALTSDRRWHFALIGMLVVFFVGYSTFVTFRLRATYQNSAEMVHLKGEVMELQNHLLFMDKSFDERLNSLETTVFADIQPKVVDGFKQKTIVREPAWSANRDKEIREQIRQLQRQLWRLEYER